MVIKLYLYGTFLNLGYKDSNSTSTTVTTFIDFYNKEMCF